MTDTILPHIETLAEAARLLNAMGVPQISGHINASGASIGIHPRHALAIHHEWTVSDRIASHYVSVSRTMGDATITTTLYGARWAKMAILAGEGGTIDLRDGFGGEQ